jgi:hypothetical protein
MKIVSTLFLAFLMLSQLSPAQCVPDPIKSPLVEGYLVFGFEGRYRILDKAEVGIHDRYNRKTIASALVDENGHFYIKGIKPGNYILSGHSEALISAYVDIRVVKKKTIKELEKPSMILIVLSGDIRHECGGSSVTIESKSKIDEILQTTANKR